MNIEGAKLTAVLQSTAPAEGSMLVSIDNGTLTGGFADALMGQIESLSETKTQGRLTDQLPKANILPGQAGRVLSENPGDKQKLGPLSGNTPASVNTVNPDLDANTALAGLADIFNYSSGGSGGRLLSVESHVRKEAGEDVSNNTEDLDFVLSVAETLSTAPLHSGQSKAAHPPMVETKEEAPSGNSSPAASLADFIDSGEEGGLRIASACRNVIGAGERRLHDKEDVSDQALPVAEALPPVTDDSRQEPVTYAAEQDAVAENFRESASQRVILPGDIESPGMETRKQLAAVGTNAIKSDGRESKINDVVLDQIVPMAEVVSSSAAYSAHLDPEKIVNNPTHQAESSKMPSSFLKPPSEEFKSNPSDSVPALEETLQKDSPVGELAKEAQHLALDSFERTAQSVSQPQIETQSSPLNSDGLMPQGIPEIVQLNRQPVDTKQEIPALMRSMAHPDWNKDLGERIIWMTSKDLSSAEIKLNPQHLGPISVRIDMNNDQATIAFTAQHAAVRDALEASIPKLREMMSHQQLNLVDINVSQHSSSDQNQSQSRHSSRNFSGFVQNNGDAPDRGDEFENGRAVVNKGLLSIYA